MLFILFTISFFVLTVFLTWKIFGENEKNVFLRINLDKSDKKIEQQIKFLKDFIWEVQTTLMHFRGITTKLFSLFSKYKFLLIKKITERMKKINTKNEKGSASVFLKSVSEEKQKD